ncbi:uncharacterized protein [Typha angustifolia]|uniref:uncharacterized protein isoform X2 n=1 Tax=Typha angustifolia TaxID=59011 RepID=UPI003C2B40EA
MGDRTLMKALAGLFSFSASARNDSEVDELGSFSEIDDVEVDRYLHTKEEKYYKRIIWEKLHKEYLEEQTAKESSIIREIKFLNNCSKDAQLHATASTKTRKERKRKLAEEPTNLIPVPAPLEAPSNTLIQKDVKKQKIEPDAADAGSHLNGIVDNDKEDEEDAENDDDPETFQDDGFTEPDYDDYYEHGDQDYTYNDDFDFE